MDADQSVGDDPGLDVAGRGSGLLGDDCCERVCVAGEHLLLACEEGRALDDRPSDCPQSLGGFPRFAPLPAREEPAWLEHEASERGNDGFSGFALTNRVEQLVLERLEPVVEEVFLGREVVEDGLLGDVGLARDLGDGDRVEAPLEKKATGGLGDQLARLLFLALTKPELADDSLLPFLL
jgi:hypothetical protein